MNNLLITILIAVFINDGCSHIIKKRQLFREQVLPPHGKIPDHAFHSDRLALNRLQKEGIAIPDGIILEQRAHQVFPHLQKSSKPTYKVALTPDGRYTPDEGKYHHHKTPSAETTYAIPQFWNQQIKLPLVPYLPVYKPLRIPNHVYIGNGIESYDHDFPRSNSFHDTSKLIFGNPVAPQDGWHPIPPPAQSYQSVRWPPAQPFLNNPWKPSFGFQSPSDYVSSQLIGDFDSFFKSFNSRIARNIKNEKTVTDQQQQKVPIFKRIQ